MEKMIGEDETDDRTRKMKERIDHDLAQQEAEGDDRVESAQDPRQDAQEQAPHAEHRDLGGGRRDDSEEFNIGSPGKYERADDLMDQDADELDDGPNISSERRMKSLVRAPATKGKKQIQNEEPATKRSIID
jgi:hypothetical protein